jgi:hypothetical protein
MQFIEEKKMKLLTELFSTDYGLMSIGVILFMLGMVVFLFDSFCAMCRKSW